MQYLIILAIFLVPIASIITIKGTCVWYPQLLALQLMGGICYSSMFWKLNKFLAIFISYLFFSYIFVASSSPRTMMCLLIGLTAISVTLVVSKLEDLKWIYIAMIGMFLLSLAYTMLQTFGIDPIFVPLDTKEKADIVSFMGSHNQLAIYSCANAFWNPWLIPIAVVPIFLVKCNSALIGLISGSFIYAYFLYGFKRVGVILFILLILILPWWHFCHKGNGEILERFNIWKLTVQQAISGRIEESDPNGKMSLVQINPLFGFGLGNFFVYSPPSQYKAYGLTKTDMSGYPIRHFYEHAHNDLVEALYEFGYVGFLILMSVIVSVVFVFISSVKSLGVVTTFSSLMGQSVSSLSVYIFHAPVSLFIFCLTLGLFYAEVNKNAKPSQIKPYTT